MKKQAEHLIAPLIFAFISIELFVLDYVVVVNLQIND